MNTEMLTDLFDAEAIRSLPRREIADQLRQRRCDETQLHEPIDAFPGLDLIRIEPEMLLRISKRCFYLPSLPVVFNNLRDLQCHVCCEDTEISIRFRAFRTLAYHNETHRYRAHFRPHDR